MAEILTESFCERCGTRYTFESTAPKGKRLGRFVTLSKGLKNFVMSDETSLDEALAAARGDQERETVAEQLDAFHKTFNFCMTCRQYTCGNCWNETEGRCLTCAPHLGHEILPAPFPNLQVNGNGTAAEESSPLGSLAWPTADIPSEAGPEPMAWPAAAPVDATGNGAEHAETIPEAPAASLGAPADLAWPTDLGTAMPDDGAPSIDALLAESPAPAAEPPVVPTQAADQAEAVPSLETEAVVAAAEPSAAPPAAVATELDERAAAAAAQTRELLARFRPGQNIDEALDEYEATVRDGATQAAAEPAVTAVPEPVVAEEPALEPEPVVAAEPEPEPVVAEPMTFEPEPEMLVTLEPEVEPAATAEPEPELEPVAASAAEPPPADELVAARGDDRVELPTWRIVAPDNAPTNGQPAPDAALPAAASAEPTQWPTSPQWPGQPADVTFLATQLAQRKSADALWAASSQELLAPVDQAAAKMTIQSCVSCGLSLSSTARFCRRCGSRQEG